MIKPVRYEEVINLLNEAIPPAIEINIAEALFLRHPRQEGNVLKIGLLVDLAEFFFRVFFSGVAVEVATDQYRNIELLE